jgi:phospholipid/cholesterol/gamma-HCH transport system ATP-binding protein
MSNSMLSFEKAGLMSEADWLLKPFSFSLAPGEVALIRLNPEDEMFPLGDLAEGILSPSEGRVIFQERSWDEYSPSEASAMRGRIGRVFRSRGMISNLDIDENITLPRRHHTTQPEEEITREALALAQQFGFEDLPRIRPALMRANDLRRAEWVRAFMGHPVMIILEEPMLDVYDEYLPVLVRAVGEFCRRGAAVLWMTSSARIEGLNPAQRYQFERNEIRTI